MSHVVYYTEVNAICIVVLASLLGSIPRGEYQSERGRLYKHMLRLTILMCVADLVSGVFRGSAFAGAHELLWLSNGVFLASGTFIGYFWVLYSMQVFNGRRNRKIQVLATAVTVLDCALILSSPLNGWVFTIDAGNLYCRGNLVYAHWACIYAFEIVPSLVAPFSKAARREKRAIMSFIVLPIAASVLQSAFYGVTSCQAGLTGGLLLLYVMLQNQEVNEAKVKAALLDEVSNTDALTGLRNRRAYEAELDALQTKEWVGVAFLDLNGLKTTNDTQGHKAGDAMICRFAQLLLSFYAPECIFRISGDEFVILCTDQALFESRFHAMRLDVEDSAAAGRAQGPGKDVLQLVRDAEKLMYEDKSAYYVRTGKDRRTR